MDVNYFAKWASFWFFASSCALYYYYSLKYSGLFLKPFEKTNKFLKLIGLSHFLIALQMTLGLYYVLKLQPPTAAAHVGFSGLSILSLSVAKLYCFDKNLHCAKVEIVLTVLGFLFLSFHILSRIF